LQNAADKLSLRVSTRKWRPHEQGEAAICRISDEKSIIEPDVLIFGIRLSDWLHR
jgi:hypothetical protein